MPVIVLETQDFTNPFFLIRTWEIISSCVTFSLVSSLDSKDISGTHQSFQTFCMTSWCFFFSATLLIHILSTIQFHSLLPISWKNLIVTVAALGASTSLSSAVIFPWLVMDTQQRRTSARAIAAAVFAFLCFSGYLCECVVLQRQSPELKGYMGSKPGLLKLVQVWGGFQMIPLIVELVDEMKVGWQAWVSVGSYTTCLGLSLLTLAVILGDLAARCCLPFDRFLAGFSLVGVLLYMVATVVCFTKLLQLSEPGYSLPRRIVELFVLETVVASVTLLAYTVDLAFSIKLLCYRGH